MRPFLLCALQMLVGVGWEKKLLASNPHLYKNKRGLRFSFGYYKAFLLCRIPKPRKDLLWNKWLQKMSSLSCFHVPLFPLTAGDSKPNRSQWKKTKKQLTDHRMYLDEGYFKCIGSQFSIFDPILFLQFFF